MGRLDGPALDECSFLFDPEGAGVEEVFQVGSSCFRNGLHGDDAGIMSGSGVGDGGGRECRGDGFVCVCHT